MPLMTFDQVRDESHRRYRKLLSCAATVFLTETQDWRVWSQYGHLMLSWRIDWTKRAGLAALHSKGIALSLSKF